MKRINIEVGDVVQIVKGPSHTDFRLETFQQGPWVVQEIINISGRIKAHPLTGKVLDSAAPGGTIEQRGYIYIPFNCIKKDVFLTAARGAVKSNGRTKV